MFDGVTTHPAAFEVWEGLAAMEGLRLVVAARLDLGDAVFRKLGPHERPGRRLLDVGCGWGSMVMHAAGFELRDVEQLREHYGLTLRAWVANLEASWPRAVELVGEGRARVWRLYTAASALSFEAGVIGARQSLGVKPSADGASGMPPTRAGWD
ncbi:MAG: class I SAM-dependent methyltransferase [Ilumatobacteraceae bacterium]